MDNKKYKKVDKLIKKIKEIDHNLGQLKELDKNSFRVMLSGRSYYDHFLYFDENKELKDSIVDSIKTILEYKKYFLEKELEEEL